jgi:curved DNA-binding protein CbpA
MSDYFVVLEQPRRPWLDAEDLKRKYLALSASAHPDQMHGASPEQRQAASDHHAELNAAYQRLREPKDRLAHLIELEFGRRPTQVEDIPADAVELFLRIGRLCAEADAFLAGHIRISSPVVKATSFQGALEWTERLQTTQRELSIRQHRLEHRLKEIDAAWDSAQQSGQARPALPWAELEDLYRQFSFLRRWMEQLQERIVQLSL